MEIEYNYINESGQKIYGVKYLNYRVESVSNNYDYLRALLDQYVKEDKENGRFDPSKGHTTKD